MDAQPIQPQPEEKKYINGYIGKPLSPELAREYGRRGGIVRSEKKKLSHKLTWLKKKGLTDEKAKELYEQLSSPELSSYSIYLYIKQALDDIEVAGFKDADKARHRNEIMKRLLDWQKLHHGEKLKTENKNININIDVKTELNKFYEDIQ